MKSSNQVDSLAVVNSLLVKGMNNLVTKQLVSTNPKSGKQTTMDLYIIPFLCGEYAKNYFIDKLRDKLFNSIIGRLEIGQMPDQQDNSLCRDIIITAAKTKCIPAIHVMFEYVYPRNSQSIIDILVYIANRNSDLFIWLISNLPFPFTINMLDMQDSEGVAIRDVLFDNVLSKLIKRLTHADSTSSKHYKNIPFTLNYKQPVNTNNDFSSYAKATKSLYSTRSMRRLKKKEGTKKQIPELS
jgi:hypothetical protein